MPALRARNLYPAIIARLHIKRQAIDSWRVVPADRVMIIAEISGLTPHVIRPDIFPDATGRTYPIDGRRTVGAQRRLEQRLAAKARRANSPRRKRNGNGRIERRNAGPG
jgi:hypothetical protein